MKKVVLVLGLLLCLPSLAFAASDIIATYKYADGSMVTLCTRDSKHVRMDTSPTSYLLLSGDKVYSVSRDDEGQWHAMDMDKMKSMGGGFTSMFGGGGDAPEYSVRYEKTGKTENICGYKGNVYTAVTFEDGKVIERSEMVMCNHTNLKRLTEGWIAVANRMSNMNQAFDDSLEEAKRMGYGGVLRYGNDMRLASLKTKNLDASYYKLPSSTQQVEMPQQAAQDDAGLGDDAKEIGQDAKQATKDELKEGIRDVIGSIFD